MWSCFLMMQMIIIVWLYLWKKFNKIVLRMCTWLLCFHICGVDWCLLILQKLLGWKWSSRLYLWQRSILTWRNIWCVLWLFVGSILKKSTWSNTSSTCFASSISCMFLFSCTLSKFSSNITFLDIIIFPSVVSIVDFAKPKKYSFIRMWL